MTVPGTYRPPAPLNFKGALYDLLNSVDEEVVREAVSDWVQSRSDRVDWVRGLVEAFQ